MKTMSKSLRIMSLVFVFSMLAIIVPMLSSGGKTVSAAGDFVISNGVLTKYTGAGGEVDIPEEVITIGASVFKDNTSITAVYIPITTKTIDSQAFYGCTNLTDVLIGSSVETIGAAAFNGCTSLEWLSLSYVKTIQQSAFLRCPNLQSLTIPTETTSIEMPAFDCPIYVSSYNQTFSSDDNGNMYNKAGTKLLYVYPGNEGSFYSVPTKVTSIGTYAFLQVRQDKGHFDSENCDIA